MVAGRGRGQVSRRRSLPQTGGTLVLDCAGLAGLAAGEPVARAAAGQVRDRSGRIVTAATTLTELLRGGARDAVVHRTLKTLTVEPITPALARRAGELLGATGLEGHRCALDALIAAVALDCPRPVVLLTSDVDDLTVLTEELDRPKNERIAVHYI